MHFTTITPGTCDICPPISAPPSEQLRWLRWEWAYYGMPVPYHRFWTTEVSNSIIFFSSTLLYSTALRTIWICSMLLSIYCTPLQIHFHLHASLNCYRSGTWWYLLHDYHVSFINCLYYFLLSSSIMFVPLISTWRGSFGEQAVHELYPKLLKRLDDSSDGVRIVVCGTLESFLQCAAKQHYW